jgi:DNA repair protein RadA
MKEKKIEDLPGVGAATAEKLKAVGYDNFLSIAVASAGEIIEASGLSESAARKIIQAARSGLEMGFQTGLEVLSKRETVDKISTGSENLNEMLGGGFETGAVTECFGAYGSSKTQIGHQLSVNCQKEDPDAVAVYIDTENTFRPERIKPRRNPKEH